MTDTKQLSDEQLAEFKSYVPEGPIDNVSVDIRYAHGAIRELLTEISRLRKTGTKLNEVAAEAYQYIGSNGEGWSEKQTVELLDKLTEQIK